MSNGNRYYGRDNKRTTDESDREKRGQDHREKRNDKDADAARDRYRDNDKGRNDGYKHSYDEKVNYGHSKYNKTNDDRSVNYGNDKRDESDELDESKNEQHDNKGSGSGSADPKESSYLKSMISAVLTALALFFGTTPDLPNTPPTTTPPGTTQPTGDNADFKIKCANAGGYVPWNTPPLKCKDSKSFEEIPIQ